MATFEPVYASSFDSMEYCKRKINITPLPYLIRPRRKLPVYDTYALYNDFNGYSSLKDGLDSESYDDDSSLKAVETSSLERGNASLSETDGLSASSLSDEEYVVVDDDEVLPNSKTERVGAIQMMCILVSHKTFRMSLIIYIFYCLVFEMELSKDAAVDESESEDAGSDSDAWVVV